VDDVVMQRRFKEKHRLPYPLLSDAGGKVAKQYGGTLPVLGVANRTTFVIDRDRTVKEIARGNDAMDPSQAIAACPLPSKQGVMP
jgi:thioredoxin-dependent peroxiredoxin